MLYGTSGISLRTTHVRAASYPSPFPSGGTSLRTDVAVKAGTYSSSYSELIVIKVKLDLRGFKVEQYVHGLPWPLRRPRLGHRRKARASTWAYQLSRRCRECGCAVDERQGGGKLKFKLSFRRFPPPRSSCLSTSPGPLSAPEEAYRRVVDARTTLLVVRETVRSTMEYMLSGNFKKKSKKTPKKTKKNLLTRARGWIRTAVLTVAGWVSTSSVSTSR